MFRDTLQTKTGRDREDPLRKGSKQADTVLKKELRVLHLDWQAAGMRVMLGWAWFERLKPQSPPPVTHFFQ